MPSLETASNVLAAALATASEDERRGSFEEDEGPLKRTRLVSLMGFAKRRGKM
jgi:hypothetical protein